MITKEYVDGVFNKLSEMSIELDANPLEFGPGALNVKTAAVRGMLSDTERVFMQVSHSLHKYKRDLLRAESALKITMTRLMAEDPHVRSGRSQQEREALALLRLTDETEKIDEIKLSVADLEEVMKVVKAKRTDLKDIQGRLRDQLKLCQEQLALGERWGGAFNKSPDKRDQIIHTDRFDSDIELDKVFSEAIGQKIDLPEPDLEPSEDNPITGVNVSASEDTSVDDFLASDLGSDPSTEIEDEIDFSGLLDEV